MEQWGRRRAMFIISGIVSRNPRPIQRVFAVISSDNPLALFQPVFIPARFALCPNSKWNCGASPIFGVTFFSQKDNFSVMYSTFLRHSQRISIRKAQMFYSHVCKQDGASQRRGDRWFNSCWWIGKDGFVCQEWAEAERERLMRLWELLSVWLIFWRDSVALSKMYFIKCGASSSL